MSFLNPSPQEDADYVRRASLALQAADLLLAVKLLSVNRRIDELRQSAAQADRSGGGIDEDAYLALFQLKHRYESTEEREALRMEILQEMFKTEMESDGDN